MKILVIGSGGREHALAWKLNQSEEVSKIYALPGNGGISEIAELVNINPLDLSTIVEFAQEKEIDLTVVGPEAALVAGIVDLFQEKGLRIFGPTKNAAQLEGSKVFAKNFMRQHNIPTADFEVFSDYEKASDYLKKAKYPLVVKADGLCGGKGAYVAQNFWEAEDALKKLMLDKIFGSAGESILIEDFLDGEEASIIAFSDAEHLLTLASSQDHKKILAGDKGPNTGGMGAYSPAPVAEGKVFQETVEKILKPAIYGMAERGIPFVGALYAGLMIVKGEPYVLEFNVRLGDPETEVILPRLKTDLAPVLLAALEGKLDSISLEWQDDSCLTVVLAAGGYPGSYEKGKRIRGIKKVQELKDIILFQAGTKKVSQDSEEFFITNGGRVLDVTALGKDIREARQKAYQAVDMLYFDKMYYRKDIALKALGKEKIV